MTKLFGGYQAKYRKFFQFERNEATQLLIGYRIQQGVLDVKQRFDGMFALPSGHPKSDRHYSKSEEVFQPDRSEESIEFGVISVVRKKKSKRLRKPFER